MNHKTYFFNMLYFYKWGVRFNSGKLTTYISWFLLELNRFKFFNKYISPFLLKHFEDYSINYMDYWKWVADAPRENHFCWKVDKDEK